MSILHAVPGQPVAETVGDLARPCPAVPGATPVPEVEALFRKDEQVRAVAVPTRGGLGLLTRTRLHAVLSGELGYGRALLSRAVVERIVHPADVALASGTPLISAAATVLARTGPDRYDDVLVLDEAGATASVPVATVLEEVGLRFREIALRDPLTGLPNRRMLDEHGHDLVARHGSSRLAVLYVDLDGFKQVNDTLGHRAGDEVLVEFADRLSRTVRAGDLVCRLGGDEFAVLLSETTEADAMAIADRVVAASSERFTAAGQRVAVSASVGVAMWQDVDADMDLTALDVLLRHADGAMLHAKRAGKARAGRLQGPEWAALPGRRAAIRRRLAQALRSGALDLYYQPQLELGTGTVTRVEALLRWTDAEIGPVPPSELVRVAEDSGQIHDVGRWVLATACRQARTWLEEGEPWAVAVNVSPMELVDASLAQTVLDTLAAHDLPAHLLHVEITETTAMADLDLARRQLDALRAAGVQVHLDDFGTGYSSLSRLRQLPVSTLKIDQSIVGRVDTDPADAQLLAGIVNAAHTIGLTVVAEGVERETQLTELHRLGCDAVQGYLIGRPQPAREVRRHREPVGPTP